MTWGKVPILSEEDLAIPAIRTIYMRIIRDELERLEQELGIGKAAVSSGTEAGSSGAGDAGQGRLHGGNLAGGQGPD